MSSYHGLSDALEAAGLTPNCPYCREPMGAANDHAKFICFCQGATTYDPATGEVVRTKPAPETATKPE